MESPHRRAFDAYADELAGAVRARPETIGLVFFGSSADRSRVDEWSDHDFALVVSEGTQEALRSDLSWLPRFDQLVAVGREHHDGFKAFYSDGAVIEFAVVSLTELGTFLANSWVVAYDKGGVAEVMDAVAAKTRAPDNRGRDSAVFLTALLVGVGRARRGEVLSASGSVRGVALDHLLTLLRSLPAGEAARLDDLDPRRRFEFVHPELGAMIGAALDRDLESCARELLRIAETHVTDLPHAAVAAVRARLGWS